MQAVGSSHVLHMLCTSLACIAVALVHLAAGQIAAIEHCFVPLLSTELTMLSLCAGVCTARSVGPHMQQVLLVVDVDRPKKAITFAHCSMALSITTQSIWTSLLLAALLLAVGCC